MLADQQQATVGSQQALRMGFKICFDKYLNRLFAGIDFDTNWCIAKIHFGSATIFFLPRMMV